MYSFSTYNSPFIETYKGRTSLSSLSVLFPISRRTGVNASKTAKTGDVPADWMVHLPITSATMRSMDSEHFPIPGNGFPQNPLPDKSFTRFFQKIAGVQGAAPPVAPRKARNARPSQRAKLPFARTSLLRPRTSNRHRWARARCPCPPEAPVHPRGCGGRPWRE